MKNFLKRVVHEAGRLKTELFVLVAAAGVFWWVGFAVADLKELVFVALKYGLAIVVLHATRSVLFYYINLGECIYGSGKFSEVPPAIRAAVVLGSFLFYALGLAGILNAI